MKIKVPEKAIQKSILNYLTLRGYLCKRNNAGKMFGEHKGKRWMINVGEKGWPDIIGLKKDGIFFGIEVKVPGNRPTTLQDEVGAKIIRSNGIWFVAYDLDDVIVRGF